VPAVAADLAGEDAAGGASALVGIGAVASVIAGAGELPVDEGVFGDDDFRRSVDGTRFFEGVGALATGCDFFLRVGEARFVGAFGARVASLPASADTSRVQRTPRSPRVAGILIARFDKGGSPVLSTVAAIHVPADLLRKTREAGHG